MLGFTLQEISCDKRSDLKDCIDSLGGGGEGEKGEETLIRAVFNSAQWFENKLSILSKLSQYQSLKIKCTRIKHQQLLAALQTQSQSCFCQVQLLKLLVLYKNSSLPSSLCIHNSVRALQDLSMFWYVCYLCISTQSSWIKTMCCIQRFEVKHNCDILGVLYIRRPVNPFYTLITEVNFYL